jgi:hypothetical protein
MTYTAQIYFLGKYRPLTIEDTSPARIKIRLSHAIEQTEPELREWIADHLIQVIKGIAQGYASQSIDHSDRGVSLRVGPHDRWLDHITAKMPECPGLNYNA